MTSPADIDTAAKRAATAPGPATSRRPPTVTRFRCGHLLAQHEPAAARYCRAATWQPAFDSPASSDGSAPT